MLDRWIGEPDPDIRWVVRRNLGKARLDRVAPERVAAALRTMAGR